MENRCTGIKNNDKYIFISYDNKIMFYDHDLNYMSTINANRPILDASNKYIMYCNDLDVNLYSLNEKYIMKKWRKCVVNLTMCDKYIYFVDYNNLFIYDLDGKFLKQVKLETIKDIYFNAGNIVINGDEIFLSNWQYYRISVFSLNGKFLRKKHCYNHYLNISYKPEDIAIYSNNICVFVRNGKHILIFDHYGKFLFQIEHNIPVGFIIYLKNKIILSIMIIILYLFVIYNMKNNYYG